MIISVSLTSIFSFSYFKNKNLFLFYRFLAYKCSIWGLFFKLQSLKSPSINKYKGGTHCNRRAATPRELHCWPHCSPVRHSLASNLSLSVKMASINSLYPKLMNSSVIHLTTASQKQLLQWAQGKKKTHLHLTEQACNATELLYLIHTP